MIKQHSRCLVSGLHSAVRIFTWCILYYIKGTRSHNAGVLHVDQLHAHCHSHATGLLQKFLPQSKSV